MKNDPIFVAGHRGLVGSAIVSELQSAGYNKVLVRTRKELDLTHREAVQAFFKEQRPRQVIIAAAKVGGIKANSEFPVDFLLQNLQIQNNVIEAAHCFGVEKLLFLGSSCIYPKLAPQPLTEDCLLTGPLEPTNDAYAIAKIAGIRLCRAYRQQYGANFGSAMPTNMYGPGDNFDLQTSHVLPALIRKVHEAKLQGAKEVVVWGTGTPKREFLYSADLAAACRFLIELETVPDLINVGCGEDVTIKELAELVCEIVGFKGALVFDSSKPDGTPRKLMDVSKLTGLGWRPKVPLKLGIEQTYSWFLRNKA